MAHTPNHRASLCHNVGAQQYSIGYVVSITCRYILSYSVGGFQVCMKWILPYWAESMSANPVTDTLLLLETEQVKMNSTSTLYGSYYNYLKPHSCKRYPSSLMCALMEFGLYSVKLRFILEENRNVIDMLPLKLMFVIKYIYFVMCQIIDLVGIFIVVICSLNHSKGHNVTLRIKKITRPKPQANVSYFYFDI